MWLKTIFIVQLYTYDSIFLFLSLQPAFKKADKFDYVSEIVSEF